MQYSELHNLDVWGENAIRARAERPAERALEIWPLPVLITLSGTKIDTLY